MNAIPPGPASAPPRPAVAAPAKAVEAARAIAWLKCEPLDPVPLAPDSVVSIGRADDCQLVLAHASVSRCHAVLRVIGQEIAFEDRSTFGSYVNGERKMSATVVPGDVLTIGPFEVRVVARDALKKDGTEALGETRPLTAQLNMSSGDAMSGRLEKQPLAEVLQALEFNRKTGSLDVVCGEVSGNLVVYEGAPIHATFGKLSGEQAVHVMVAQRVGYYSFRTKIEPGEQTITKTLTALLLEASRLMDEGPGS